MTINRSTTIEATNTQVNKSNANLFTNINEISKSNTNTENFAGIQKFNSLFGGSEAINKDSNLSNNLISHLNNMNMEEYGVLAINLAVTINENTDMNKLSQHHNLKIVEAFQSKESSMSYFSNQINRLTKSEEEFGDDASFAKKIFEDLLQVFQNSQKQVQENKYIELGQNKNNNA
jgi:hypothetical protein